MAMKYEIREAKTPNEGFTVYGGVREFVNSVDHEVVLCGPAETGKTIGALYKLHLIAMVVENAQMAIVRKTYRSTYTSVLETYEDKVLGPLLGEIVRKTGGSRPEVYEYPTGSRIIVAGMDKPEKVLSSERDVIYVNQAEELSLDDWEVLLTRCTGRAGHVSHPQLMGDCNPSHEAHWILARSRGGLLRLINSRHRDNPTLFSPYTGKITVQGRRTLSFLGRLSGSRRRRLLEGEWASPEGAIYESFDPGVHVIHSFDIPEGWPCFAGVDPVGPYVAVVWVAWERSRRCLHVYREYVEPFGATTPAHVSAILSVVRASGERVLRWIGGGPTEDQARVDWTAAGLRLEAPPISSVWSGIDRVNQLLMGNRLLIHDCCVGLASEIGSYRRVIRDGVPTDGIERKSDYHRLDALRYVVSHLTAPREVERVVYDEGLYRGLG